MTTADKVNILVLLSVLSSSLEDSDFAELAGKSLRTHVYKKTEARKLLKKILEESK